MGALSITPNPKYQDPFKPLLPGCPTASVESLESVKKLISKEKTAAVIIEPIQGEGGVKAIPLEFLIELKKLCKENNALLIYDEIQCGLGRTGKLWAHSSLPVEAHPDILTMAKALGNGFPIGATMISEEVEKVLHVGDHGTTYGGNPLGSRIGSFVVEKVSDEEFLSKVEQKSEKFVTELKKLQESKPDKILEVRGRGLLLGLQFAPSIDVGQVSTKCRENGLIVITAGQNVLRLVPALNIDDEVIDKGLNILRKVIEEL